MRLLNILALLILLVPMASAELIINKHTNDFVLSSPNNEQLKLCACETRVDTIIIENIGEFASSFNLWVESEWPGSVRLAETTFTLGPRAFREIPVYISDSCNTEGVYDYTVHAINSFGREERLSRTIRSDVCMSGRLEVSPDVEVGLCEPADFEVRVTNIGRYAETFHLETDNKDAVQPFQQDLFLQPDESRVQNVSFTWACEVYGQKDVTFTLTRDKQDELEQETRTATIRNDYSFSLDIKTRMDACALGTTRAPIGVENTAYVADTIELELNAPPFVTFADGTRKKAIALSASEKQNVNLEISPKVRGEYDVSITARDTLGGTVKERSTSLIVNNCYDATLELRKTPDEPLLGPVTDCCGLKTYYVNIRNTADQEQVFQLELDGPSMFLLDERTIRVQPSQSLNVRLEADLPCSDEEYSTIVKVWPLGHPELSMEKQLDVTSLTQRSCHMVQIDDDELSVRETDATVPITVRHTGIEGGLYSVETNGTLFNFTQQFITLQPGDEKTLYLVPNKDLATVEKGRRIVFPTFTFVDMNIPYNEFVGLDLQGKGLFQRMLDALFSIDLGAYLTGCAGWVVLLLLVLLALAILLLFVWAGKLTLFTEGLPAGTLGLWRTLLVLGMILLIVLFILLPAPGKETQYKRLAEGNATVLEWYQGETLTLDLDQYFTDPDLDDLSYTTTQPRDIRASIDDNLLVLEPDPGFTGENTMIVTASDNKQHTNSPTFILRVIGARDLSLADWLNVWCKHLTLLLLLFILLVLYLFVIGIKERRNDLRSRNVVVVVPESRKAVRKKTRFYASRTGTKAHVRGCVALKNVKPKDRVTYKSKAAILNAGLALCSTCTKVKSRIPTKHTTKKAATKRTVKAHRKASRSRKEKRSKAGRTTSARVRRVKAVPAKTARKTGKGSKVVNIQVNIDNK